MKTNKTLFIGLISIILVFSNMININLKQLILLFTLSYVLFFICSYSKYKNIKSLIFSSEFIMMSLFFVYSLPSPIMFILDDYTARVNFFLIDLYTITSTLHLYLNIFNITFLLILLLGGIKTNDKNISRDNENIKLRIDIFDVIAVAIVVYFYYLHLRNGLSVFTMYFQNLRTLISSKMHNLNSYIYLYMICYSFANLYKIFYSIDETKKAKLKKFMFMIIFILFWTLSILTDRRNLFQLLILILFLQFNKLKKINMKKILKIFLVVIILLFASFVRSKEGFNKNDINNVIHLSFGEFIYVNYVTDYYINNNSKQLNGRTYFYDTFASFIPRSINKNKPIPLGEQFKIDARTNVAYAFNPVAEGILNFGIKGATFVVPIVLLFFIKLSYSFGKRNILYYYLICSEFLNFIRGTFSVTIFSIIVMLILIKFMVRRKEVCVE